ncbi:Protein of uncharacterised function (DUF3264) [Streptococcus equi subsp. zooepidemicus]|nr:Protein of uncharacterised function (DUF3264) [Streptococcus equi subsp. zooepidemicus]
MTVIGSNSDGSISIHSPVWGETFSISTSASIIKNFNPLARMGRDNRVVDLDDLIADFNPLARMGRDNRLITQKLKNLRFQSTRPYGARHDKLLADKVREEISIHSPVWGETKRLLLIINSNLFQSTRPYGARRHLEGLMLTQKNISIHSPVWGETWAMFNSCNWGAISIHSPVWGETQEGRNE